ncbi:MAG: enoyl-CoA hydratase-related protein [Rhodococcus sp. (in: high G+C Gram-positive bacteria)]|uniref:enoyl-CoA hydratase/isomerase family protein n=1 Tax=Rhodococcus sp. TaxID=1831 RepID=UPI003BB184DC
MTDILSPAEIGVEVIDGFCLVTLDRPARLNAFTSTGYLQLTQALAEADLDDAVRVILIRGAGRAFSSGVDLDALATSDPEELRTRFAKLVGTLAGMTKPVVAAPHGVAVGFGMTLLLLCDVVLVAEGCRLRAPFTALGTVPEAGSSYLLPALIGRQAAMDIVLSSRWIHSVEAVRLGLAAKEIPLDDFDNVVRGYARTIAEFAPASAMASKRLLSSNHKQRILDALAAEYEEARSLPLLSRPID